MMDYHFIIKKRKSFFIYCNDMNCNQQRLRFTIMHEIGHIVLGHKISNDETESEADYFARNALAPLAIVIKKNITSPDELMNVFDISYQCSGIVIRNLGLKIQYGHMELEKYDLDLLKLFNI